MLKLFGILKGDFGPLFYCCELMNYTKTERIVKIAATDNDAFLVDFLGSILHVFRILVRTVFLLTLSLDVFRMHAHFQNTGSSKNIVFLK